MVTTQTSLITNILLKSSFHSTLWRKYCTLITGSKLTIPGKRPVEFIVQGAFYLPQASGNSTGGALFIRKRLRLNTEQCCITVI